MKRRRVYRLQRQGALWVTRAALSGVDGRVIMLRLLVDTGASFTIIPLEVAERLGCDLQHPLRKIRMVAANGVFIAPLILTTVFDCLSCRRTDLPVVAFTLPAETYVDGLLSMDFLGRQPLVLDPERGEFTEKS